MKNQPSSSEGRGHGPTENEGTARCLWKLAKVTQLLPGRDGIIRAAKVQFLNTDKRLVMLCRPIQYLVPLEVNKPNTVT